MSIGYAKSVYGQKIRVFSKPLTKDDVATAGTCPETYVNVPEDSLLVGIGIMSTASDVICSTTTSFELRTTAGTIMGEFTTGSLVLGTGRATAGLDSSTATYLKRGNAYMFCVGTDVGDSGSVHYFVDVIPRYKSSI